MMVPTKISRIRRAILVLAIVLVAVNAHAAAPNVLIFFIDDLGRSDVVIDGATFHETPHLDALAQSGVRFTDFYSAHPVCSPTRAALMTGKVPQRVGITDWIHPGSGIRLPGEELTIAEAFQAAGYQTAYLGKWHLGEADQDQPTQQGFEWTLAVNRAGQPASYYYPYKRQQKQSTVYDVPDLQDGKPGDYLTDAMTTGAIEFLHQRDRSKPFFMCFSHYAIHTPIQPPVDSVAKYRDKRTELFAATETPTLPALFGALSRGRQDNADYAAMMENLDANIGRILTSLDELQLREDTIVVFTSDNGGLCTLSKGNPGPTCNLPWRSGKGWLYEGGIRIPTFISWPTHVQTGSSSVPAYTADLYPTLLELCSLPAKPTQHLDGRSLASALQFAPQTELVNRSLAWYYPHSHGSGHRPSAAIRRGAWKLIHYLETQQSELYQLEDDPGEHNDLARQEPERVTALLAELQTWIKETTLAETKQK